MNIMKNVPGVVSVIQARVNSSRLPGKVMLPLGGMTVLEQVIRRVQAAQLNGPIVVATPDGSDDHILREVCEQAGVDCVTGSERDVLARLLRVAHHYEARVIVRCQASNPLLDPKMLWASARYAVDSNMDFVTVGRLPIGVATEAVPVRTLEHIALLTNDATFREQVTTFTSTRPDLFVRAHLPPPPRLSRPDLRLTLETEADYWFLQRLYAEVAPGEDGLLCVDDCIVHINTNPVLRRHSPNSFAIVRKAA